MKIIIITVILLIFIPSIGWTAPECGKLDVLCVGLVTDVGQIDDKSFNQSAWEGVVLAARQLGAHTKYLETRDAKDYAANIGLFVRNHYDVIVTVGFALGEATTISAKKYPDILFIGIDQFQSAPIPNLAGLVFHEEQAGFLAGALAAMLSKTGIISAVLGTDLVPPIVRFQKGFEAGSHYMKKDIKVISSYHPGGLDMGFTDPEWGAASAKQAIDQGADVIFGAGGKTGNGCLIEVATHPGKYCIGVDTDQWETLPEARGCLVSSAVKMISASVFNLIKKAHEGKFPGGNDYGEVGLAPFHDFHDRLPQDIKEKLIQIQTRIQNGSIAISLPQNY